MEPNELPELALKQLTKKVDPITAVKFTGGFENGSQIVQWIRQNDRSARWIDKIPAWESRDGKSSTPEEPEHITLRIPRGMKDVFVGDWIWLDSEGDFRSMTSAEVSKSYIYV